MLNKRVMFWLLAMLISCNAQKPQHSRKDDVQRMCDYYTQSLHVGRNEGNQSGELTQEDVIRLTGANDPTTLPVVNVRTTPLSCVDGRSFTAVVSTPGGDAGEWLLAMVAVNQVIPVNPIMWTAVNVARWVLQFVTALFDPLDPLNRYEHPFYMHSDKEAINKVIKALNDDPRNFPKITNPDTWTPADQATWPNGTIGDRVYQNAVLALMEDPDNTGCGHIKYQLKFPAEYEWTTGNNPIRFFVRAFFQTAWATNRYATPRVHFEIHFPIFPDEHNEMAVLPVTVKSHNGDGCDPAETELQVTPLPTAPNDTVQYFVNYDDETKARGTRGALAQFFSERITRGDAPVGEILAAMVNVGGHQLSRTLEHLNATSAEKPYFALEDHVASRAATKV